MAKLKLEKITGAVALSYLILIPVGAYYAWQRMQAMESDITDLWEGHNVNKKQAGIPSIRSIFGEGFRAR